MKIVIEEYKPEWNELFISLKAELTETLAPLNPVIEHIGSTSVNGLAAKPVIDIAVGLSSKKDLEQAVSLMLQHCYIYYKIFNSLMPKRRLFIKLNKDSDYKKFKQVYDTGDMLQPEKINNYRLAHIHIWEHDSSEWIRHIAFREYLKNFPIIKNQYAELKKSLSLSDWKDGNEYNDAKNDFIKIEEAKAIKWYKNKNS